MASPELAGACSCVPEKPAREALQQATRVFRGVITAVEPAEPAWRSHLRSGWCTVKSLVGGPDADICIGDFYLRHPESYGHIATFRVIAIWKGAPQREVRVRTDVPGGGSCGLGWVAGEEWVLYAYGTTLLEASGCSRSRFGERVAAESEALGTPVVSFE
jgi:hypothetical protein